MGAIFQHSRFRHRHMDQLADQEEEASGYEKTGERHTNQLARVLLM